MTYQYYKFNNQNYRITWRIDKTFFYAKVNIEGIDFEGHGTDEQTAYWDLDGDINIYFNLKA